MEYKIIVTKILVVVRVGIMKLIIDDEYYNINIVRVSNLINLTMDIRVSSSLIVT